MTEKAAAPTRREHVPLGIAYMIGATILFSAAGAITKWAVATYPVGEVGFIRQVVSTLLCAAMIMPRTGFAVFRTQRLGAHAMRGFSQFTSQMCLIIALTMLPLGAAMSISFSAPLFAVLIAVVLYRERVGLYRGIALLVGFVGVLLITEPRSGGVEFGTVFALLNAIIYASVTVAVRRMSATESADTLTMYQMVALLVLMASLLPLGFVTPTPADLGLLALCGVSNGLGQFWWTKALSLAPAPAIMPFYYLSLAWAIGFGFVIWGDVPTRALLIGAAVIVVSGLYLIWRETLERRRLAAR